MSTTSLALNHENHRSEISLFYDQNQDQNTLKRTYETYKTDTENIVLDQQV